MQRMTVGIVLLVLACPGCNDGARQLPPTPTSPTATSPTIRIFSDPVSGNSTDEVNDAQEQVFQMDSAGQVIWKADGGVYRFPRNTEGLIVRFATKNGERRAYLVYDHITYHYEPPEFIVDLEVVDGLLILSNAKPAVPLPGS